MEKIGWKVETIDNDSMNQCSNEKINIFIKKIPILPFSVIKILRYKGKIQLIKLKNLAKKHRAILIKLEPFEIEKTKNGQVYFKVLENNKWPLTPTKTLWVNLKKSENQILSEMKQKTRYNIRLAQRKKIKAEIISGDKITTDQLLDFYNLWKKNKPHNWLFRPNFNELKYLVECFDKKCFFVFIHRHSELDSESIQINTSIDSCFRRNDKECKLIAACLILTSSNVAFYWHNTSTDLGKKLFAPTLCIWEAIRESKKRKLKIFDFEGLWDERYPKLNKNWKGFSRFKEGFVKT